jgi:GNAT superfamily N-acetyltransferase
MPPVNRKSWCAMYGEKKSRFIHTAGQGRRDAYPYSLERIHATRSNNAGKTMKSRQLLQLDERQYRIMREQAAIEGPLTQTGELQRELAMFDHPHHSVIQVHEIRGTRIWGAFDDFTMAGVVAVSPMLLRDGNYQLWLWGLYVQPKYRGKLVSRLLVEAVQAWGHKQYPGASIMASFHTTNHHARQMVMRFGFAEPDFSDGIINSALVPPEHIAVECTNRLGRTQASSYA